MRAVILVEPEKPENTGFIARLCENFEFELRIVNPQFNLSKARKTANNAQEKLRNTKIFDTTKASTKDLEYIIGTKPGKGISSKKFTFRSNTSIMLGRESSGLTKEELKLCDSVVHIPSSYSSLNLSHAASVLMYESYKNGKEQVVDGQRLDYLKEEYGPYLSKLIGRASPTENELDRLIGELNH